MTPTHLLRRIGVLFAVLVVACAPLVAAPTDSLEEGFRNPPASTKPKTFWHWMNGNVTRDGITRDLEAMQRVGIGGVMIFDGSTYLPAGSAGYLSPEWRALMAHAIHEGNRLGLEVGMHNAPGWSSSGGPWIKPEQAMQQIVWTETTVTGGRPIDVVLAQPQMNEGFYRDAFVVAFPALPGESTPYETAIARVTTGTGREVANAGLSDGLQETRAAISPEDFLQIEFTDTTELHAITVQPGPKRRFPTLQVEASEDGKRFEKICAVSAPAPQGIVAPAARSFPSVRARFVRLVPKTAGEIADVVLHRTPRIEGWPTKANFDYRVAGQLSPPKALASPVAIDPRQIIDLTSRVKAGRLTWDAPAGTWTILRQGHTPTGKRNVAASAAGTGLECDKMNAAVTEYHFKTVIEQVMAEAAKLGGRGLSSVTIDSYEAGMQNWTAAFPEEFQRRAGYDLRAYLPTLVGRIVGDAGISERFLFDFRRVQADLMAEYYYGRMGQVAREHGLSFYVEGYGSGPFDELRVSGSPDVPMTEFWTRTPWTPNRAVKMVTSAAHVYGKSIVAAESFTGEAQTSRWLEYPYALKILGDDMFSLGMNQMVFHRYAHQPHPDAVPGMTMGPWGFHFDRTNTWFEQSAGWLSYLRRAQFLLRQGTYVADVLYFTGEHPPESSQFAIPLLPAGYTYDLVNADALLKRVSVKDGRFVLPEGGSYRVLVLPSDLKAITPALMTWLRDAVEQGATVLGPKPEFSPTLSGFPATEVEMRRTADELWNPARSGPGRVIAGGTVADALHQLDVRPDFEWSGHEPDAMVSWQHRKLADGDLFFVSNRQRKVTEIVGSFRGMAGREPELWSAETGELRRAVVYAAEGDRVRLPLQFDPGSSVFVLFRDRARAKVPDALVRNGEALVSASASATVNKIAGDVAQSFTMAMWVKPDTDLRAMPKESTTGRVDEVGKFYAIPADPGDVRFGAGHATAGLAVGRNGAYVIERSMNDAPAVAVWRGPVSGWTHVAVVYRDGKPRLYVNGVMVREGLVSGKVVHSGVGSPPPPVDYTLHFAGIESLARGAGQTPPPSRGQVFFFEGNFTRAETIERPLDEAEIAVLVKKGIPPPEEAVVTELSRDVDGRAAALVWQSGDYALDGSATRHVDVAAAVAVDGPWKIAFQPGRGAPPEIELPELKSLHFHSNPGVKYFSGTATYRRTVKVPAEFLGKDRRVVLDLGRVEVVAEVAVNGRGAGLVWKEPYRIDITDAVHTGENTLEIRVTNLWTNRLIGDESLPAENEFGLHDERGEDPHGIVRLPDWYLKGLPKPPGGRTTFTTWRFYEKDEPLVASGLLGPVRLINPQRVLLPE